MKTKLFAFALATLCSACCLLSCGNDSSVTTNSGRKGDETEPHGKITETSTPLQSGKVDIDRFFVKDHNKTGSVDTLHFGNTLEEVPERMLVTSDDQISQTFPVYNYKYGNGEGGPFISYTDEDVQGIKNSMRDSIKYFISEEASESIKISDYSLSVYDVPFILLSEFKIDNDYGITGTIGAIDRTTLLVGDSSISLEDVINGSDNAKIVNKCVEYMDIKDPQMICEKEYDLSGEFACANIYVFSNDLDIMKGDESPELKYISVYINDKGEMSSIHMFNKQLTSKLGEYEVMRYDDALNYIKDAYGDQFAQVDESNIKAVRIYEYTFATFDNESGYDGMGYYEPCYRFFLGGKGENSDKYAVVDVRMTDFNTDEIVSN